MPLILVRNDITKMQVDAIVNAANETLLGGGGVDGAIHRAAGPALLEECRTLGGCRTGEAKCTLGYRLPAKYVIHTVGPIWHGGSEGEEEKLTACYKNSLSLAKEKECGTVAFPLISAGVYGYPKREALRIACETIRAFLETADMTVYLVLFDRGVMTIGEGLFADIRSFIDSRYVRRQNDSEERRMYGISAILTPRKSKRREESAACESIAEDELAEAMPAPSAVDPALEARLRQKDESFSQMLLRRIDEAGMTDAQCYNKANIDRKLFSKIRSNPGYRPSKPTVLAFAVALRLPLEDTKELLMKAGYALSDASKADIIVEYFIERGRYDVFEINDALFAFDQPLLGA